MKIMLCNFQADIDNSGSIDYGEFLAATLHLNKVEREDNLFAAFSYFDKDGSGYITHDELQKACEEFGIEDAHLEDIIHDVDQDNVSRFASHHAVCLNLKAKSCISLGYQSRMVGSTTTSL